MSRLNILKALEPLGLPKEFHENAYRFLYNLEDTSGNYYNPHAAEIIRKLLSAVASNRSDNNSVVLFLGQIESLLLATCGGFDAMNYVTAMQGYLEDDLTVFKGVTKVQFQETINSLLYGKRERTIYAMENYYPKVSFVDMSSSLLIHTSVMIFLKNTPDMEQRHRKLEFLARKANDQAISKEKRLISSLLAGELSKHIDDKDTAGGESFDRLFRKLTEGKISDAQTINACIKARNVAVHEGRRYCDNHTLGVFFGLLFTSKAATDPDDGGDRRIEEKIKTEVARDIRDRRLTKARTVAISAVFIGALLYLLSMIVVSVFIGKSDIQRVRWQSGNSQLNARINEIIATKDTTRLLEVQEDLQWIQNEIH